jgi:hypothetical protein
MPWSLRGGAPVLLRPGQRALKHQRARAVLVDPTMELGRLRFNLATTVEGGESLRLDLVLEEGCQSGPFIERAAVILH